MEKERNWMDVLSGEDIPAEVVDWAGIIADPGEAELSEDAGLLDAEATIGEPVEEEDEE
ncbi:hypothetical protein [Paenibacillus sp. MMS20-IR301]|uniref:hypothetical protein n=1 Tax=Paenibacillus sp. MMS20-IR301 TaxID=2895946 RepID=UPI0028EC17E0|nr:hypothetical protein [Paenibacillus sp. MMS20-IR301]WNS41234.1 hypothetical protein LOS79_19560 [Paenibacillus sp. MMS20-IR301]